MMTEEEKAEALTNQYRNGQDAKALKNGLENLLAMFKAEIFNDITSTKPSETNNREEFYRQLKTIEYVEKRLITSIQTGEFAKQQLSAIDKAKQYLNNMIG